MMVLAAIIHSFLTALQPSYEVYFFNEVYGEKSFSIVFSDSEYTMVFGGGTLPMSPCEYDGLCWQAGPFFVALPDEIHSIGYSWTVSGQYFRIDTQRESFCNGAEIAPIYTISRFENLELYNQNHAISRYEYSMSCGLIAYSEYSNGQEIIYVPSRRGLFLE